MPFTLKPDYLAIEAPRELVPPLEDGGEPFKATIRVNLTIGEVMALTPAQPVTWQEAYRVFAPHVVDWNVSGIDAYGETVDAPAPAEGGPDMFDFLTADAFMWLVWEIKTRNLQVRSVAADNAPGDRIAFLPPAPSRPASC